MLPPGWLPWMYRARIDRTGYSRMISCRRCLQTLPSYFPDELTSVPTCTYVRSVKHWCRPYLRSFGGSKFRCRHSPQVQILSARRQILVDSSLIRDLFVRRWSVENVELVVHEALRRYVGWSVDEGTGRWGARACGRTTRTVTNRTPAGREAEGSPTGDPGEDDRGVGTDDPASTPQTAVSAAMLALPLIRQAESSARLVRVEAFGDGRWRTPG